MFTLHTDVSNRMGVMRSLSSGARGITLHMEFIGSKGRTPPTAEFFINEMGICGHEAEPVLQQLARMAGNRAGEIQLSGQLSRLPGVLPLLIGMGYRSFAADPLYVTRLGRAIPHINSEQAGALAEVVCRASDAESVRAALGLE